MYKYNERVIRAGRSWKDDAGFTHPANWMVWPDEIKAQKGLVWEDDPEPFDSRFYYAPGVPKPLEDLVAQSIKQTKAQELSLLSKTDWMVIKSVEVESYGMPEEVVAFRKSVRDESEKRVKLFSACKNLAQFMKVTNEVSWQEEDNE